MSRTWQVTEFDNGFLVDVGDIHRGEETNVLVDLQVDALEGEPVGAEQQLVDVHVRYLDLRYRDTHAAQTQLFTSIDVMRPKVVLQSQLPRPLLTAHDIRHRAFVAIQAAVAQAHKSSKERQSAAADLARLARKAEASDVSDWRLVRLAGALCVVS